jgi:hypothetical protein
MYTAALSCGQSEALMSIGVRTGTTLLIVATGLALAGVCAHADDVAAAKPATAARGKSLDLRPPDIKTLYTDEQLEALLEKLEAEHIERIEVEGARVPPPPSATPEVWGGIGAPFWALFHPTQAWRIFAPMAPDQARKVGTKPPPYTDAGYLDPAGVPPGPFDH